MLLCLDTKKTLLLRHGGGLEYFGSCMYPINSSDVILILGFVLDYYGKFSKVFCIMSNIQGGRN